MRAVQLSSIIIPPSPVRNAQIAVLTDFSSNPLLAIRDRFADPVSFSVLLIAAFVGVVVGVLLRPKQNDADVAAAEATKFAFQNVGVAPGEGAIWLNTTIRALWRLFRRRTDELTKQVLQPALDIMQFPEPVLDVKIVSLALGKSPALVRNIQRLPSRSLSEIQYRFSARLVGDKKGTISINVKVKLPVGAVTVPITVSNLDIDADVWLGFSVVPYPPWVRFVQWALLEMPNVKLSISLTPYIPITNVPVLSKVIIRILTKELPKQFLFPETQIVDLMGEDDINISLEQGLLDSRGVDSSIREMPLSQLRRVYPQLSGLFDAIDYDEDGVLSSEEVADGLTDWGYASTADRTSISKLLDVNNDGMVDLREFITVWGDLRAVFVPRRFRGVLSGVLLRAEGLRTPAFGMSDPYVVLQVDTETFRSKRNRATSDTGTEPGTAFWNEGWEIYIEQPKTAMLRVEVREASFFTYYPKFISPPALPTTHSGSADEDRNVRKANRTDPIIGYGTIPISGFSGRPASIWIDLTTGGGRIRVDVQYSEFVEPQLVA